MKHLLMAIKQNHFRRFFLKSTLFLLLHIPNLLLGQTNLKEVGISDKDFYAHSQEKDNWCWAASIQMILEYYNVFKTQTEIVDRTLGRNYYGELPNLGGSVQMISDNLNKWEVDYTGRPSQIKSVFYAHPPSPEELVYFLKNKQPIYLSYKSSSSTNHAIVITSCRYYDTPNDPQIVDFTVRDPWPSKENVRADGLIKYNYSTFSSLMNYFWIVNVHLKGHTSASSTLITGCSSPFCLPLKKILADFDNKFINLRGEQFSDNGFRSTIKFPNEKSSYFYTGRLQSYYASFYKGNNIDSSKLIYEDLKANFALIGIPIEETSRVPLVEDSNAPQRKYVHIELDNGKVITLRWQYSDSKKEGLVVMTVKTKEDTKYD